MKHHLRAALALGKLVRYSSRLGGSGGSALPGLVVERLLPNFLPAMLAHLPDGILIVTGTNGKTTTTKMITTLLRSCGKRVLTNASGSNMTRGITATIIKEARPDGSLPYDLAVLELDEAYARELANVIAPRYVVALNVLRDQLDRFGEIDSTAHLLGETAKRATSGVIMNADDPRLVAIARHITVPIVYFGVDSSLHHLFPTDEELHDTTARPPLAPPSDVLLAGIDGQKVTYAIAGAKASARLKLTGQYNFQNAAAALAAVRVVLPDVSNQQLLTALAGVEPAFGRGEVLHINGQPLELLLVKNPAGFRQTLLSFTTPARSMIAINDNHADGRDMSWLWDVDFTNLDTVAMVSGSRAYDMALRLRYDNVTQSHIQPDLNKALQQFLTNNPNQPLRIFCTYTAMLELRRQLATYTTVEAAL